MTEGQVFRIRRMEARDIPAVSSVDRIVFEDPWPESAYVQELYFNPHARYFVLYTPTVGGQDRGWLLRGPRTLSAAQIVGFVGMRVETERGHISTLAVRPEWRGKGLGELLLLIALRQAGLDGARVVTLEVRVSNVVAQGLYAKYGFEVISRLHGYYSNGEDAFLMRTHVFDADFLNRVMVRLTELEQSTQVEGLRG